MEQSTRAKARGLYSRPRRLQSSSIRRSAANSTQEIPEMPDDTLTQIAASLQRIADRLETMAPSGEHNGPVLGETDAYHWDAATGRLMPVPKVARVPFGLLKGIDSVRDTLLANTVQFAKGFGANNALLWG